MKAWWLVFTDEPNPDAVGHHYPYGTPQGNPMAKVFAKRFVDEGCGWTICASHELLEMLVNPHDNRMIQQCDSGPHRFWLQEICDPCETDPYIITTDADPNHEVSVSNFVYPSWFGLFYNPNDPRFRRRGKAIRYDHKGNIMDKPFGVLPMDTPTCIPSEDGETSSRQHLTRSERQAALPLAACDLDQRALRRKKWAGADGSIGEIGSEPPA